MDQFGIRLHLGAVREAREKFAAHKAEFDSGVEAVMKRLLLEAATSRMSAEAVAQASGLTIRRVRELWRRLGLDPHKSMTLMSASAAEVLSENAALMGIDPAEMDLTSPLAYLPMGSELRDLLAPEGVAALPEDEPTVEERLRQAFAEPTGWLLAEEHVDEMVAHLMKHLEGTL